LHGVGDLAFTNGRHADAQKFFERLGQEDETSHRFYYQDMANMVQGNPRGRRCMMGFYAFVLEHDGNVYPCVNCEKNSFGNLLTDSFQELWFGGRANDARRELRSACCPTCTSVCYPLPVNAREVAALSWRRWRRRIKSRLNK
jgi:MoaA/NifB/PqqE/SkfB family radical SAM enzyme